MHVGLHKLKDMATGDSLSEHVLGGYRFLMRYYGPGDLIYIFGFSRGAYTARFLAEMLDDVGLLPQGNEEMVHFAWEVFANWQRRRAYDKPGKGSCNWRFLDVSKARRSRHRQEKATEIWKSMQGFKDTFSRALQPIEFLGLFDTVNSVPQFEAPWMERKRYPYTARSSAKEIRHAVSIDERRVKFRADLIYQTVRTRGGIVRLETLPLSSPITPGSMEMHVHSTKDQKIHEVWFPGNHGDVGGGWKTPDGSVGASHMPLVWMVRAAIRAGLKFDPRRLAEMQFILPETGPSLSTRSSPVKHIAVARATEPGSAALSSANNKIREAMVAPNLHDMLTPSPELSRFEVLWWNVAEWLPIKRMDLQKDGTWEPIRWKLPRGEVRDMPDGVLVHASAIHRLQDRKDYRPGNLIIGGGGRGRRVADEKHGIGEWELVHDSERRDMFDDVYVRKTKGGV
jgi:uncharacterized protein (DUF2235 family)